MSMTGRYIEISQSASHGPIEGGFNIEFRYGDKRMPHARNLSRTQAQDFLNNLVPREDDYIFALGFDHPQNRATSA